MKIKDYTKIIIPYIGSVFIKTKAENFQRQYWDTALPIDIERIIDVHLGINIIPIPNMEKLCNTNALITSDWQSVYVDKDLFDDERRLNRLRFSLAHEIGHYILHKRVYSTFEINSYEDFYNFIDLVPNEQYKRIETQANIFAGYLLAPREILQNKLRQELKKIGPKELVKIDKILLKSYVANPLSREFGISQESMEIILGEFNIFKND